MLFSDIFFRHGRRWGERHRIACRIYNRAAFSPRFSLTWRSSSPLFVLSCRVFMHTAFLLEVHLYITPPRAGCSGLRAAFGYTSRSCALHSDLSLNNGRFLLISLVSIVYAPRRRWRGSGANRELSADGGLSRPGTIAVAPNEKLTLLCSQLVP